MKNKINSIHLLAGTDIGGSEMLALNIAKTVKEGFVFVATSRGILADEFVKSNCPFYIIRRRFILDPFYIFKVYKLAKLHDVKILHAHQPLECFNVLFLSFFTMKKTVLTYHGFRPDYYSFFKRLILKLIWKLLAKKVSANIFVSQHLERHYKNIYKFKAGSSLVVYNGIKTPDLKYYDRNSLRTEFGISESDVVLGMIGNFSKARNQLLVAKVFNALLSSIPNKKKYHLIFIGKVDDKCYPSVLKYCCDRKVLSSVHFAHSRTDAFRLLRNFDVFVYASHRETFCLSVAEAIVSGIPIVANDIPVLKEITMNGMWAKLYPTDNADKMKGQLVKVIQDLSFYRIQASENRFNSISFFSIRSHTESLEKLYKKVVEN